MRIIMSDKRNNGEREQCLEKKRDSSDNSQDSLVSRLKAADHAAAAELVDIYYQQIFWFFRRMGHGCQVSEDLTQESFLAAWHHISQLRDAKALNGWLYRIAANASRLHWRRNKARAHISSESQGIDVPDSSQSQYEKIEQDEKLRQIKMAVEKLSVKRRQAVVLHYMQRLTIAEAAEAAGVREGTFKSRLNRALNGLREMIG